MTRAVAVEAGSGGGSKGDKAESPIPHKARPVAGLPQVHRERDRDGGRGGIGGRQGRGKVQRDPKGIDGNYQFSVTTASGLITITPFWG